MAFTMLSSNFKAYYLLNWSSSVEKGIENVSLQKDGSYLWGLSHALSLSIRAYSVHLVEVLLILD